MQINDIAAAIIAAIAIGIIIVLIKDYFKIKELNERIPKE